MPGNGRVKLHDPVRDHLIAQFGKWRENEMTKYMCVRYDVIVRLSDETHQSVWLSP
jgi:hypothetical protein